LVAHGLHVVREVRGECQGCLYCGRVLTPHSKDEDFCGHVPKAYYKSGKNEASLLLKLEVIFA
jgi:hypothetical protein